MSNVNKVKILSERTSEVPPVIFSSLIHHDRYAIAIGAFQDCVGSWVSYNVIKSPWYGAVL